MQSPVHYVSVVIWLDDDAGGWRKEKILYKKGSRHTAGFISPGARRCFGAWRRNVDGRTETLPRNRIEWRRLPSRSTGSYASLFPCSLRPYQFLRVCNPSLSEVFPQVPLSAPLYKRASSIGASRRVASGNRNRNRKS